MYSLPYNNIIIRKNYYKLNYNNNNLCLKIRLVILISKYNVIAWFPMI